MKQISFCVLLLISTSAAFCQNDIDSVYQSPYEHYIQKSNNQKAGAIILTVVGGLGLGITCIADLHNHASRAVASFISIFPSTQVTPAVEPVHHSYAIPYLISAAVLASAIPLYILSDNNRSKAYAFAVHFNMEKAPVLHSFTITQQTYPCIALAVKL